MLEHGADPNALYKFQIPKKIIQTYVNEGNLSKIRLLIMFGATEDGVKFDPNKSQIKHMFSSTRLDYQTVKKLERKLALLNMDDKKKESFLLETGKIWEKLSKDETSEFFRSYYQKKVNHYYRNVNNYKSGLTINKKFTDNSCTLRRRFNNEKEPLLMKKNKQLTF